MATLMIYKLRKQLSGKSFDEMLKFESLSCLFAVIRKL